MIQFNLLPDVKLDYIKAQRTKHAVVLVSALVGGTAVGLLLLLFVAVNVLQKQHISNLTKDIKKKNEQMQAIPDIDKILTVQNQLKSLPELHAKKPAASRLFAYVTQLTPTQASLNKVNVDFEAQTFSLTGEADSLTTVNKFADTLKFTEYKVTGESEESSKLAFSQVVLASFGRDAKSTSFQLDFRFDPIIFDNVKQITLTVPNVVTTRSALEKPNALFKQKTPTVNQGQGH